MKYQCTKCGTLRVATRPVKASCKDFEISDAQTPSRTVKRNSLRHRMKGLFSAHLLKRLSLKKYHSICPPNYHGYDKITKQKAV